ncbi:MAG: homing endonuclease associated repeat-containing protein [Acutalibacteraceae bacterium]
MGEKSAADLCALRQLLRLSSLSVSGCTLSSVMKGYFFNLRKGGRVLTCQEKTAWATEQLCTKEKELGRLPKKEDFDDKTRSRIKAFLGPWPRALEKAGLKPVKKQ